MTTCRVEPHNSVMSAQHSVQSTVPPLNPGRDDNNTHDVDPNNENLLPLQHRKFIVPVPARTPPSSCLLLTPIFINPKKQGHHRHHLKPSHTSQPRLLLLHNRSQRCGTCSSRVEYASAVALSASIRNCKLLMTYLGGWGKGTTVQDAADAGFS